MNILLELSLLYFYLYAPIKGHLCQVMHILAYFKLIQKKNLVYDSVHLIVEKHRFRKYDWYDFNRGVKESIPDNIPLEICEPVLTHCFISANLARDLATVRSHTSILIFLNRDLIVCHRKMKNMV